MIDIDQWSYETKAAYIACALETDGWVGMSYYKSKQKKSPEIRCNVGVTNQNIDFLKRIATIAELPLRIGFNRGIGKDPRGIKTTKPIFSLYYSRPIDIKKLLEMALPYMIAKREQGLAVLEYANSRITDKGKVHRSSRPYSDHDLDLVVRVKRANNTLWKSKLLADRVNTAG